MSILGTGYGLLLYSLRLIKGFPRFGSYALWGVVFVRLTCPFGFSSSYSLLSLLSRAFSGAIVKTVTVYENSSREALLPELTLSNTVQAAESYRPVTYKTNLLEGFFKAAAIVWVIVAAAAILTAVVLYLLSVSELKKAIHIRENIYQGSMVDTPTVYGILHPRIVLPQGENLEYQEQVLLHERIHIRRLDNLWRMLAILTACIHWFNPLVWFFLKSFMNDCELACDAKAVKHMKEEERKDYARALLALASKEKTVFSTAFGSSRVKIRIRSVLSYRKLTALSTSIFLLMAVVIAFILLTNKAVG
jgi:beta-lactamase regulating signal transducer with metallopeptidase domain